MYRSMTFYNCVTTTIIEIISSTLEGPFKLLSQCITKGNTIKLGVLYPFYR